MGCPRRGRAAALRSDVSEARRRRPQDLGAAVEGSPRFRKLMEWGGLISHLFSIYFLGGEGLYSLNLGWDEPKSGLLGTTPS